MELQETGNSGISDSVKEVIQRLVVGHRPKPFQIQGLKHIELNTGGFEGDVVDVYVSGPDLYVQVSSTVGLFELMQQIEGWNDIMEGTAETLDDRHLILEDGSVARTESGSLLEKTSALIILKFRKWSIEDGGQSTTAWITPVQMPSGAGFDTGPGNLLLYTGDPNSPDWFSNGHLYLKGENRYIVLRRNERAGRDHEWLVIEPIDGDVPDQDLLREEFRLLQFTLGIGADVGMIRGVTRTLDSRTAMSVRTHGLQANVPGWAVAPVPIKGGAYVRPFFRKLSESLSVEEISQAKSAVHMFLNALSGIDMNTTIVLMSTALRTLTQAFVQDQDLTAEARLISEVQRWREWVQDHETDITQFGVSDWVKTKERIIKASKPQIEDLLRKACEHAGLDPDDRLIHHVSGVHYEFERRGWASEADWKEDQDRIEATANLFVSLLGSLIGYKGEVGYKTPHGDYFTRVSLGISKDDKEEAFESLKLQIQLLERDLVTWPYYEEPKLPDHDLVQDLATFASELRGRTKGAVNASLRPYLPRVSEQENRGGESVHHLRFVLQLSDDPSKRIIPFDIEVRDDNQLQVEGWQDDE